MKNVLRIIILLLAVTTTVYGQSSIEVTVKGIKGKKGSVRIGLFNNEKDFMITVVEGKIVKADSPEVTVVFENLPAGDYAVSVIHDENENGVLDSSKLGIPKEGFAFGNNAMGNFKPPTFTEAKVALNSKPLSQTVTMKYF